VRFLNGLKTALGAVGLAVVALSDAHVLELLPAPWRPFVAGASAVLVALGVVHKVEKAADARAAAEGAGKE
jgi:hypothetical protein